MAVPRSPLGLLYLVPDNPPPTLAAALDTPSPSSSSPPAASNSAPPPAGASDAASIIEYDTHAPGTLTDILTTQHILLHFLPFELVLSILDVARYYVRITTEHSEALYSSTSLCCLVSAPILDCALALGNPGNQTPSVHRGQGDVELGEGDARFKIACVEFKTVSHDQGWVSDGSLAGTYRGYTWFEAAIFRPSQLRISSRARSSLTTGFNGYRAWDSDLEVVVYTPPTTATKDDRQTEFTEKETKTTAQAITRWNIQHNLCASKEHKEHRVVWTSTSTSSSQYVSDNGAGNASINADGSGNGIGFIENLKAGDQIAVISRAMYSSWVNYVKYVEVSVYYGLA
ncbi:hypothetical protein R3P38DRAFT_3028170 [Favolaschia claudopus]|uniref:Uncharacterized protein n=1 Tax=Favolaschia claudopus TaxID=2862362 RepID=A0AAW0AFL2_9AGAR